MEDSVLRLLTILMILSTTDAFSKGIDSIDSLNKFLMAHPDVRRINQVIPNFSEEVRGNFLRMYNSPSLQEASHDFPRVIMFSKDAKFIVAFNGDPSQKGYDRLEAFQFDDVTEIWQSFSRRFSGDAEAMIIYAESQGLPVPLTPAMNCVDCHRSRLRPNWDDYSLNPGVVHDGKFFSQREEDGHRKFIYQHLRQHPRYKHLIAKGDMFGDGDFGIKVTALNYRRIARIIQNLPDIEKMKYAVIAAFGGCDDIDSYIPLDAKPYGLISASDIQKDQFERGSIYIKEKLTRYEGDSKYLLSTNKSDPYRPNFVGSEVATWVGVSKVRFVMQWIGEDMEDWSMAFTYGAYAFRAVGTNFVPHDMRPWGEKTSEKEVYPGSFALMLAKRLGIENEIFDPIRHIDCPTLKAKSLLALEGWKPKSSSKTRQHVQSNKPSHKSQ